MSILSLLLSSLLFILPAISAKGWVGSIEITNPPFGAGHKVEYGESVYLICSFKTGWLNKSDEHIGLNVRVEVDGYMAGQYPMGDR